VVSVTRRPRFSPEDRTAGTHCTGGWVGPRADLDRQARGKILSPLPGIEPRSPGRPARSQTLYWLSYPAPFAAHLPCFLICSVHTYIVHFCFISSLRLFIIYFRFTCAPWSGTRYLQWPISTVRQLRTFVVFSTEKTHYSSILGIGSCVSIRLYIRVILGTFQLILKLRKVVLQRGCWIALWGAYQQRSQLRAESYSSARRRLLLDQTSLAY
jgi:hypothetical protein